MMDPIIKLLFDAADSGDMHTLYALIQNENIDITHDSNWALRTASLHGRLNVVITLLTFFPTVADQVAILNNAALISAAIGGHLDVVRFLLKFSRVVQDIAIRDNAVLRMAALHGQLEVVKLILTFDPVMNNIAINQNEALRFAAYNEHSDVVDYLLTIPAVRTDPSFADFQYSGDPILQAVWERSFQIPYESFPLISDNEDMAMIDSYSSYGELKRLHEYEESELKTNKRKRFDR